MPTVSQEKWYSIQVWPSGRRYEVLGDINSPSYVIRSEGQGGEYRRPDAEEAVEIEASALANTYAERDIRANQTALMGLLLGHEEFYDAITHPETEDGEVREVMQWFLVSEWLADQLETIGQITISNCYGHWWGRTTCGQNLIMDGVLQEVAKLFIEGK